MTFPNGDTTAQREYQVLIIGAGFAGVYLLHKLRGHGFDCKILEAGDDIGGTWCHNRYPGARVDTNMPLYQLSIPEVYQTWTWSERFPAQKEILAYFHHIDHVLNIKKDVMFNKRATAATYSRSKREWHVQTEDGCAMRCEFFIVAAGFASQPYMPCWDGVEDFKGDIYHSYQWPKAKVDLSNKRVAIIGTGATGVQMVQEIGKEAANMTLFQRTPNLCLPMCQQSLNHEEQQKKMSRLPEIFRLRLTTFAGYANSFAPRSAFADTPAQRESFFTSLWQAGGFAFWIATYSDILFDRAANRLAYDFWAQKTRARIPDPSKRDVLAPLVPPHPFGTRRPCLETDYYEQLSKSSTTVVDVNKTPILRFVHEGIMTADAVVHSVDVICIATGFDALTGSLTNMGLSSADGVPLTKEWARGVSTNLGMTIHGYPNLFYLFAVHGPTASNGPSCIELQGDWIVETMLKMRREGVKSIEATREAEQVWTKQVHDILQETMIHETKSWYSGANVAGKLVEPLIFFGGFPEYRRRIYEVLDGGFQGFVKTMREEPVEHDSRLVRATVRSNSTPIRV